MKSMQARVAGSFLGIALAMGPYTSRAAGTTLIDNASDPDRATITFPEYLVRAPGKWTIVVADQKSLRFRSLDGSQTMQAGMVDLHPKLKQSEEDAFRGYVDNRRLQEHDNIDNKALKADAIDYASNEHGKIASWCIIDPAGASAHLTAILEDKRKLLVVSYDADKVTEADFRAHAALITSSMTIR